VKATLDGEPVLVSGYTTGQSPSDQVQALGYTSARAANLDNLDVLVSSVTWSDTEKKQIRFRLGIDGQAVEPSSGVSQIITAIQQALPVYWVRIETRESSGVVTFVCQWFKDSVVMSSGITQLSIVDLSGNVIASGSMAPILGGTVHTMSKSIPSGTYVATVSAVVDGGIRTFSRVIEIA